MISYVEERMARLGENWRDDMPRVVDWYPILSCLSINSKQFHPASSHLGKQYVPKTAPRSPSERKCGPGFEIGEVTQDQFLHVYALY